MYSFRCSIVMPMRNASAYLRETLESVISQTFTNWELIAVDDCSTDDGVTVSIANSYAKDESRIRVIALSTKKGSSGARNEALKYATGRYICFLDSDDVWHSKYLETMLEHISSCTVPKGAIFFCGYRRMNEQCTEPVLPDYCYPGIRTYNQMLHHCPMFPSITIIDTDLLTTPIHFREELQSLRDDYAMILDVMKQGVVAVGYSDVLVDYRMRSDSLTASKRKMIYPQWRVYREVLHLGIFKSLWYMFHWAVNGLVKYHKNRK